MPYDSDYKDLWQNYDPDGDPIKDILNKLIGQQQMIKSTIQEVREDVEGEITYNQSLITQTADEIRQEVYQGFEDMDGQFSSFDSRITQNANAITSRVTYTDFTGANMVSMINQTASNITILANKINFVGASNFTLGSGVFGSTRIEGGIINASMIRVDRAGYGLDLDSDGIRFLNNAYVLYSGNDLRLGGPGSLLYNGNQLLTSGSGRAYDSARLGGIGVEFFMQYRDTAYDSDRLGGVLASNYSRTSHNHGNTYIKSRNSGDFTIGITSAGVDFYIGGSRMGSLFW